MMPIPTPPTLIEAVRNVSDGRCERQGVQALWSVYAEGDAVYLELAEGGRKKVANRPLINGEKNDCF